MEYNPKLWRSTFHPRKHKEKLKYTSSDRRANSDPTRKENDYSQTTQSETDFSQLLEDVTTITSRNAHGRKQSVSIIILSCENSVK